MYGRKRNYHNGTNSNTPTHYWTAWSGTPSRLLTPLEQKPRFLIWEDMLCEVGVFWAISALRQLDVVIEDKECEEGFELTRGEESARAETENR